MTLIQISKKQWSYLNNLKEPGQTFEDVLNKILEQQDEARRSTGISQEEN